MKLFLKKIALKWYLYVFFGMCFAFLGGAYFYHYYQDSKEHLVSHSDRVPQGVGKALIKGVKNMKSIGKIKTKDVIITPKVWDKLKMRNLKGLDFQNSRLSSFRTNTGYEPIEIKKISFHGASFQNSQFLGVFMDQVIFIQANLQKSQFLGVFIDRVNFARAKFQSAVISAMRIYNTNFRETKLHHTKFTNSHLIKDTGNKMLDMEKVNFYKAELPNAKFYKVRMINVTFIKAKLPSVLFDNIRFYNDVKFTSANLQHARFINSKVRDGDLLDFSHADLRGASFDNIQILQKADLRSAKYNSSTRFPPGFTEKMAKEEGMIKL